MTEPCPLPNGTGKNREADRRFHVDDATPQHSGNPPRASRQLVARCIHATPQSADDEKSHSRAAGEIDRTPDTATTRAAPSAESSQMIFNSKQLEELENIHDSTGAFEEEGEDDGNFEEIGEAAMDWRRGLIEEAAENIKRAKTRPVEPHLTYPIGSMLFEREARRFARVQRSVPGYLKIIYLSGGDREFGNLDVVGYLRDYGAEKRLSELSEQLGMNDIDVATELERLGITPIEEPELPVGGEDAAGAAGAVEAAAAAPPLPPVAGKKGKKVELLAEAVAVDDDDVAAPVGKGKGAKTVLPVAAPTKKGATLLPQPAAKKGTTSLPSPAKGTRVPAAAPGKIAEKLARAAKPSEKQHEKQHEKQPAKAAKAAAVPEKKKAAASSSSSSSSSKINPIDDPNAYIKAHYSEMSNRELARFTGLSEHTIRRKLGEWGLKRK
jgi:hypothetical protein